MVLFKVKWYKLLLLGDEKIVSNHTNGFVVINTSRYEPNTELGVLPTQREHVFYTQVPSRVGWSFVVRFNPR